MIARWWQRRRDLAAILVALALVSTAAYAPAIAQDPAQPPATAASWAGLPDGLILEDPLSAEIETLPATPAHLRLERLMIEPLGAELLEATSDTELLWVESGTVQISDERGVGETYREGEGRSLAEGAGAWYALESDAGAALLHLTITSLVELTPPQPTAEVLLETDLTALPTAPTRLFLGRADLAPETDTGPFTLTGPVGVLVDSGTLSVTEPSRTEAPLSGGSGTVLPLGASSRLRNDTGEPVTVLFAGMAPADLEIQPSESPPPSPAPPTPSSEPSRAPTIRVPDLTGQSLATALGRLEDAGLKGDPTRVANKDVPANRVIRTDPGADEIVEPGSRVRLWVSSGSPTPPPTPSPTPRPTPKVTPKPPAPPAVPTGLRAAATGRTAISVSWRRAARATRYELLLGGTTLRTTATSRLVRSLAAGRRYCFRVRAAGPGGYSPWSGQVCERTEAVPPPPTPRALPTPQYFSATAQSRTTVLLTWDTGIADYTYHVESDRGWKRNVSGPPITATVPAGERTCFRLYAFTSEGQSDWTRWDCATTPS